MIKKTIIYGVMIIAIIFMFGYLMNEDTEKITKESRKQSYSVGLEKGEKLQVNVAAEIIGAIKHREIWEDCFYLKNLRISLKTQKI